MKNDRSRPVWVVIFVLGAFVALGGMSRFFGAKEAVAWRRDWDGARQESARVGRPVFVYFTAAWCGPCQTMRRSTWSDRRVSEALAAGYVPVKVDIDQHPEIARGYGVESIPWFGVLGDDGRAVKSYGGAVGADDFLEWLKR